jgi:hypothetical protein
MANAMLATADVTSTGELAAFAVKRFFFPKSSGKRNKTK